MENIVKWITKLLSFLATLSFAGIIITVTMQILSRYLPFSYVWTEELTRYFFLFSIAFGAPVALLRNEYINVDLIIGRITGKTRKYYDIVIYVTILVLSIVMTKEGYHFMVLGQTQKSATMPFQMSLIHASMLIMGLFLAIYCFVRIIYLMRNTKNTYDISGGDDF